MKNEQFNFVGTKKPLSKKKINVDLSFAMSPNPYPNDYGEDK